MFLILSGLLGLVAGLAAGGRVQRLTDIRFRLPGIVLLAFVIKEVGVYFGPLARSPIAPWLYVVALTALIGWTVWHRDVMPGIEIIALGMAMNLLVVLLNFGHMPVSRALADRGPADLIKYGVLGQYILADHARLAWLGDWIALPGTLGKMLSQAYSPGDLVAAAGMIVTIFVAVRPKVVGDYISLRKGPRDAGV